MEKFDADAVGAEIRAAFEAYEAALGANDVEALASAFWEDPQVVRLGPDGGLYGHDRISAFRKGRETGDLTREISEVRIIAFGKLVSEGKTTWDRDLQLRVIHQPVGVVRALIAIFLLLFLFGASMGTLTEQALRHS